MEPLQRLAEGFQIAAYGTPASHWADSAHLGRVDSGTSSATRGGYARLLLDAIDRAVTEESPRVWPSAPRRADRVIWPAYVGALSTVANLAMTRGQRTLGGESPPDPWSDWYRP